MNEFHWLFPDFMQRVVQKQLAILNKRTKRWLFLHVFALIGCCYCASHCCGLGPHQVPVKGHLHQECHNANCKCFIILPVFISKPVDHILHDLLAGWPLVLLLEIEVLVFCFLWCKSDRNFEATSSVGLYCSIWCFHSSIILDK